MHRKGPVFCFLSPVVSRPGLRAVLTLVLGATFASSTGFAAAKSGAQAAGQNAGPEYAGSDVCATCHEEVAKGFSENPHVKMAEMHGKSGVTCENCHGQGKAHAE